MFAQQNLMPGRFGKNPACVGCIGGLFLLVLFMAGCGGPELKTSAGGGHSLSTTDRYTAPPRGIGDVLDILAGARTIQPNNADKKKNRLAMAPPNDHTPKKLAGFYMKSGGAAASFGQFDRARQDFKTALAQIQNMDPKDPKTPTNLMAAIYLANAKMEIRFGNFTHGTELAKKSFKTNHNPEARSVLVKALIAMGKRKKAKALVEAWADHIKRMPKNRKTPELKLGLNNLKADLYESKGRFKDAELIRREMVKMTESKGSEWRKVKKQVMVRLKLAENLSNQGRLAEAETEMRSVLEQAAERGVGDVVFYGETAIKMANTLLRQGRLDDAEKLTMAAIPLVETSGAAKESFALSRAREFIGNIRVAKRDFKGAMEQYDSIRSDLGENEYVFTKMQRSNTNLLIAMIMTGRYETAQNNIQRSYEEAIRVLGQEHYRTAELLALRGLLKTGSGDKDGALGDFRKAVPLLLANRTMNGFDFLQRQRLQYIAEAYLELLLDIREGRIKKPGGFDPDRESFIVLETMIGGTVQAALGKSGARAAAEDPQLAELVRREQDADEEINELLSSWANMAAVSADQKDEEAIEEIRDDLDELTRERNRLLDDIQRRFPKYSSLVAPSPATFDEIRKSLGPDEALIAIYPAGTRTHVWAIPQHGPAAYHAAPISKPELAGIVDRLRSGLAIHPSRLEDIPDFDLKTAGRLYKTLLEPVSGGWQHAKSLCIVAPGPLGRLPFGVLPTEPVVLGTDSHEMFSKYKAVPWLIRKASITRLPSASSLVTLRRLPPVTTVRKSMIGFGDPVFTNNQPGGSGKSPGTDGGAQTRGVSLAVRSIRQTGKGNPDNRSLISSRLENLTPLPDTAEEVMSIAEAMGADPNRDVLLGENASEHVVKSMDLSDRAVIIFASHALMAGDLDGLDQPAIALSSPKVTGRQEDGLLTMAEILRLKLNADWVVLSACNTGAGEGRGSEAVSGLGRAFFYAGSRSLLVSMWSVETTSARALTTGIFQHQSEKGLTRAEAARASMIDMIDNGGITSRMARKKLASYAHPFFWAPFIIVGDSGKS